MTTDTEALTYDHIVALALEHGFKLKPQVDGRMALNDYVIDFARAVYDIGRAAAKAEIAAAVAAERGKCAGIVNELRMESARRNMPESATMLWHAEDAIRAGAKEHGE